ncbi:MAG: regulatory protein RecX [Desulfuromonadales bacterium]|nr:regulatory protein RecX [Desulfuromonadales bacterium]NIR34374.1 regulatory protein RecX [Desulfuromonadales bacterium]NIS44340.1 regulatory protein RecX [Desulfuromonadales bacterium]
MVRKGPNRTTLSGSSALDAALRLLAHRDRSEAELAERLGRRGHDDKEIADVIERCRQWGYLDDLRFARMRARSLIDSGRAVGRRLLHDLRQRGVDEQTAALVLEEIATETDEDELLEVLRQRRFADFDYARADERQRRRVINFFLRRGFALNRVLAVLKKE